MYMRDPANPAEADGCYYSFPLPISPVVDSVAGKVVRIDILPTGLDSSVTPLERWISRDANEYIPEANNQRSDVKPLHVLQPEGVSFTVEKFSEMGYHLKWQKWDFKVGFNEREGTILYDVYYDGSPIFYRLSLSEMAIPYADPRKPFHRKMAFDLGDVGAGRMANNLKLGCDCLGSIYYISAVLSDTNGCPVDMPNVICIHEVDNGIMWKHTNYRTNRAVVTRDRQLVVQRMNTHLLRLTPSPSPPSIFSNSSRQKYSPLPTMSTSWPGTSRRRQTSTTKSEQLGFYRHSRLMWT